MVNIEDSPIHHQNAWSNMSLILRNTIYSTIFNHTNLNGLNFLNVERKQIKEPVLKLPLGNYHHEEEINEVAYINTLPQQNHLFHHALFLLLVPKYISAIITFRTANIFNPGYNVT